MSLRDEIAGKYLDADGLVNPSPINPTDKGKTGNGLLYTSIYYMLLKRRGDLTKEDVDSFTKTVNRCMVITYGGWPMAGLLLRSPTKADLESADDYYGVCAATKSLDLVGAFYQYGLCTNYGLFRWNYNNQKPDTFTLQTWFGRFPWLPAHIQWCAGVKPNILRRLAWAFKIALDSFSSSPEARIKGWLMISATGDCRLSSWAVMRWRQGLANRFPNGMRDVMAEYFGDYHPLSIYWVD